MRYVATPWLAFPKMVPRAPLSSVHGKATAGGMLLKFDYFQDEPR